MMLCIIYKHTRSYISSHSHPLTYHIVSLFMCFFTSIWGHSSRRYSLGPVTILIHMLTEWKVFHENK